MRAATRTVVVLAALALACQGRSEEPPLTYEGSGIVGQRLLRPIISEYTRRGGRAFAAMGDEGSGAGFARVMAGEVSLGGMSRSLKSSEKAQRPYYIIVGYDALTVYAHPANALENLTRAQLRALFAGEVKRWKELGGADVPVRLVTQHLTGASGTLDFFRDTVMRNTPMTATQQFPTLEGCLEHVARTPGAITWGTASTSTPGVRRLSVDGVAPTPEAIRTADYPLSRPMVLVTRRVPQGELKRFLDLATSPEGQALVARTFVPFHDPAGAER